MGSQAAYSGWEDDDLSVFDPEEGNAELDTDMLLTCGWCGSEYDPDFVDPNFTGYCSRGCATACWQDSQDDGA